MKQIYYKLISLAFFLFIGMNAVAQTYVTINGLMYRLNGTEAYVYKYTSSSPRDVVIPETIGVDGLTFNVTHIDYSAFENSNITSVIAEGYNLNSIESKAFAGCTALTYVKLPGVRTISSSAFNNCSQLKTVILSSVLSISEGTGNGAFNGCSSLPYIVLPAGCSIGQYAFSGCSRLQAIIYLGTQTAKGGSNAFIYNISNMVSCSEFSFPYSGQSPTPTFTNNLPMGFQPTNGGALPELERNAGCYIATMPFTFANSDQEFTVNISYYYTITPGQLTAKVKNAARLYGDANPQFEAEYSGFITGEDASVISNFGTFSTTATVRSDVGTYPVTLSGATAQNYTFQYESGTLTVTKAPLTMTARNKTMTYGGQVPTLEADYQGLKNNETKPTWITSPQITTTATMASNAGTYPITISNGEAKNYDVTFKPGTLTINKASLTATTKNATRAYGDNNPEFTMSYSGLKNGDAAPEWITEPTIASTATKTSQVGTYNINASGGEASNYNVSYVNSGKLTVTKAMLTATARSCMKRQGEDNPPLIVDYEGFKNNETTLALTKVPVATTTATLNSSPGTYPITVSGGQAINYDFTYVNGTLTILPREEPGDPTANVLTVSNITGNKSVPTVLPIAMTNEKSITAFQFDLYLPTGVTVATKSSGKMLIETTERMEGSFTISSNTIDNFVRVTGYSADGDAFTGNSGDILKVTLNIASSVADGDYTINLKDIVLSDVNNIEYHPADATCTLTVKSYMLGDVDNSGAVNINDVVCIINHILNKPVSIFIAEAADVDGSGTININDVVTLINRFILMKDGAPKRMAAVPMAAVTDDNYLHLDAIEINPGETLEIPLLLTNVNTTAAVQGNILLPDGLSFVTKSNGRLDVKNNDARAEDFTLSCALQDDGSLTFAQYSGDGFTYEGNEGAVFTFKIKAADDAVAGTYDVVLRNVVLSIDGVGYEYSERTSKLTILSTTGIDSLLTNGQPFDIYDLNGRKLYQQQTTLPHLQRGVYIINGRKVVVK